MTASQIVNEVLARYETHGHRRYGENVTELQHALQCAMFAQRAGEPAHSCLACAGNKECA